MSIDDYKNVFENVKCSDSFIEIMENMLSNNIFTDEDNNLTSIVTQ